VAAAVYWWGPREAGGGDGAAAAAAVAATTEVVSGGRLAGRVKDPDGIAERAEGRGGEVWAPTAKWRAAAGYGEKGEGRGRGATEYTVLLHASAVFAAARHRHSVANLCVRVYWCVSVCVCVCVGVGVYTTYTAAAAFSRDRERQVPDGGERRAQKLLPPPPSVAGHRGRPLRATPPRASEYTCACA